MRKQAFNPYLPSWEYIPDGEPYVFGDRVYIYGSHDLFNGHVFCLGDYVCWSAPVGDLGNWRFEGVIYEKTSDPLNRDGKMCLFAPDVTVGPDGRYYLYYVLDHLNIVSVAVCDTPAGKYEFYGYVHYADGTRLGEKEGDEPQFDPGYIANMKDSATAGFKYFDCKDVKEVRIKTRGYAAGIFEVKTSWNGEVLATIKLEFSNVWEEYSAPVRIPDGVQAIYLTYRGDGIVSLLSFTLA